MRSDCGGKALQRGVSLEKIRKQSPGATWQCRAVGRGRRTAREERKKIIQIGGELRPQEKELLFKCLQNREMALAWDRLEMGHIREEVTPPIKIDMVEYKP